MSSALQTVLEELIYLKAMRALLTWDQETQMPKEASGFRANQAAYIEGLIQEKILSPTLKEFVTTHQTDPLIQRQQVLLQDEIEKNRLPKELLEEIAKQMVLSVESWRQARAEDNFSLFAKDLEKTLALQRQLADHLNTGKSRYDTLLTFFDRDLTYEKITTIFDPLEKSLKALIQEKIPLHQTSRKIGLPIEVQRKLGQELVDLIAPKTFLTETTHPFCSDIGPFDVRLSTRYAEDDLFDSLFSTLHELGHALYEQQLPHHLPYPLSLALSMTVHESQSKLFETCLGGSKEFLHFLYNRICHHYSSCPFSLEEFIEARFTTARNPIRIQSDECTYPLHIILRTKIERALVEGELEVKDLPHTFRKMQKELLGLDVKTDREGCLQDIHWACGNFGYFPTYLTGCMYAADQYALLQQNLPLKKLLEKGELKEVRQWLKEAIHGHGSRYGFTELLQHSTKQSLSAERYFHYLKERFFS